MSVTVASIRAGIAANLAAITDVQVLPYLVSNPSPPSIQVFPAATEYDQAMNRGIDRWTFTVQAVVSASVDEVGQQRLDEFLEPAGDTSIKEALEADVTLGGAVQALRVTGVSGYRWYDTTPPVMGAEWTVEVWCSGQ